MSIAALVLGICSLAFSWNGWAGIAGILAIIFGAIGIKSGVHKGMGVAGLIMGIISTGIGIIIIVACGAVGACAALSGY